MARILLVEDDLLLRELLELLLFTEGHETAVASDGAEALMAVSQTQFDLIILDLMMPVMDGISFLQRLAESSGERPPVLVFSASTSTATTEQAISAGAAGVARKPVDHDEFLSLVRSLLGG